MSDLQERQDALELVLKYTREKTAILSVGERIMINQERANLYRQMEDSEIEYYEQPIEIETKIYQCLAQIRQTNWKPKPNDYE
jgi:hypothetical protein